MKERLQWKFLNSTKNSQINFQINNSSLFVKNHLRALRSQGGKNDNFNKT